MLEAPPSFSPDNQDVCLEAPPRRQRFRQAFCIFSKAQVSDYQRLNKGALEAKSENSASDSARILRNKESIINKFIIPKKVGTFFERDAPERV